jgi:hypothetical protein
LRGQVKRRSRHDDRNHRNRQHLRNAGPASGLIYDPEVGAVDFTVPHFADFMRRRYPLASLLKAADEDGS